MNSALQGKTVLVTGSTGFIGPHLVRRLGRCSCRLLTPGRGELDITDEANCRDYLLEHKPHTVFHLAGNSNRGPDKDSIRALFFDNTAGTVFLLEGCRLAGVHTVVTCGSADEAHGGINLYGRSRRSANHWVKNYGLYSDLNTVVARLFMVYGPGQTDQFFLPSLVQAALRGETLRMSPGEQSRDFVWVEDVVESLLALATSETDLQGEVVDVGTGSGTTLREVVLLVEELTGAENLVQFGALPYRPGGPYHLVADLSRLEEITGYRPGTSLRHGLTRLLS